MARYGDISTPFKETDKVNPVDPYGVSKVAAENILKILSKTHGIEYNIAVPHNIIGPKQKYDDPYRNVASIMINLILQGRQPTIYGDGTQKRDFTHVEDIADGLYRIALSEHKHEDAWELGTGKNHSINELYSFFKERYPEVESKYIDDLPGNYRFTLRQNDDTLDKLNWNPTDRLKEYINKL